MNKTGKEDKRKEKDKEERRPTHRQNLTCINVDCSFLLTSTKWESLPGIKVTRNTNLVVSPT